MVWANSHHQRNGESRRGARDRIALVALAGLLVSGCTTSFTRTTGTQAGLCGLQVADAALGAYEDLRAVAGDNAYYQGYLRIVVSPQPDAVDFTQVSDAALSVQIEQRIRTYRQVRAAYALLQQLCSGGTARDASQAYAALFETLRGLSADDAASAETKKMVSELPADLSSLLQARQIARAQSALGQTAKDLSALWDKELPTWNDYIDSVYVRHYAAGLLSLRLSNFDERELNKVAEGPYGAPIKAGLFKLQKYREAVQKADSLKAELLLVSNALQQLAVLHRQLSDTVTPFADVLSTQRQIGHYVGRADKKP